MLEALVSANEPKAMLSVMQRIAEGKAHGVTFNLVTPEESDRWYRLAVTLQRAAEEF